MSLHQFIRDHRRELVSRTNEKALLTVSPAVNGARLEEGLPLFLEQLAEALQSAAPSRASTQAIETAAAFRGGRLLALGLSVGQVVHAYGDVCQAVTELATEFSSSITLDEFHTLNRCLDDATAEAVAEYCRQRDQEHVGAENEHASARTHELRSHLQTATLAFELLTRGHLAINGSVSAAVTRNLAQLGSLLGPSFGASGSHRCAEHRPPVARLASGSGGGRVGHA